MAYKLLGDLVNDPDGTDASLTNATLIYVAASASTELILEAAGGGNVRRIRIPANGTITLVKDAGETVACLNSDCTPIAYHW